MKDEKSLHHVSTQICLSNIYWFHFSYRLSVHSVDIFLYNHDVSVPDLYVRGSVCRYPDSGRRDINPRMMVVVQCSAREVRFPSPWSELHHPLKITCDF